MAERKRRLAIVHSFCHPKLVLVPPVKSVSTTIADASALCSPFPNISSCTPQFDSVMAQLQTSSTEQPTPPRPIPPRTTALSIPPPTEVPMPPPASASRIRTSHLSLDTFSPVNQNGSFEFDRVLKSGYVQKRTRKTKVCLQAMNGQKFFPDNTCRLGNPSF